MKKTNILKIFMTLVLAFVITGAFAQFPDPVGDYAGASQATDYVTINKSMPYFVHPDQALSPDYDATVNLTDDVLTTFVWAYTDPGADATGTATEANKDNNYVELSFDELGTWTVQATETYGSCPGTPVTLTVEVVPAPDINSFPYFGTTLGMSSTDTTQFCGDQGAVSVDATFNGFPNFQLDWSLTVSEIDGAGNVVANGSNGTLVDNTAGSGTPQVLGAGGSTTRATPSAALEMESRAFTLLSNAATDPVRTRYVYTINGVTDLISRKSDYLGTATWYDNAGYTFTIIVNPDPVTGPIYHIDNFDSDL